ncbi:MULTISPECIES: histidine phosphatase family protein [Bacillus]|uniref:histidine phosphatase family protein n=1 Tax=Bacillus TaxID=1386 RepID=UPI0020CFD4E1|nr:MULTISPECIES: histidine phosphatase family protein [Bacillus]MDE1397186.1 histidine phosphatase family protein [Bacillus licheniformis]WHF46778.1 histidine phosphatase family protein [Bacillus licheniformis]
MTSPLKRAKETAEVINKDLDIPLIKMDEFVERFFYDAEGMTVEERLKAFPTRKYPNQEDRDSLNKRIMIGIEKINQEYRGKKI